MRKHNRYTRNKVYISLEKEGVKEKKSPIQINLSKALLTISLLISIITLAFYFNKQLSSDSIEIGHLGVPQFLVDLGYSENVLKNLIKDEINNINSIAISELEKKDIKPDWLHKANVSILNQDIPLETVKNVLQSTLDINPPIIQGEVIKTNQDSISLNLRIKGDKIYRSGLEDELPNLLSDAVIDAYKVIDPYVIAVYQRNNNDIWGSLETIKLMLADENPNNNKWAWNLWGLLLMDKNFNSDALEKFEKALKIDSTFYVSLYNKGLVLRKDSLLDESEKYFLKALEYKRGFEKAKEQLVSLEVLRKDFVKADSLISIFIKENDENPEYYNLKSLISIGQNDSINTFSSIQKALSFSPNSSEFAFTQGLAFFVHRDFESASQYFSKSYHGEKQLTLRKLQAGDYMTQCFKELEYDLVAEHEKTMDSLRNQYTMDIFIDFIIIRDRIVNF